MQTENRSGFIAVIGRPNVGKSTFLNNVLGEKIAIMSDKVQTTRNKVQGVLTQEDTQFIFIDTPGIHKPRHRLGSFMVQIAEDTLNEVDIILFMINAEEGYGKGDAYIMEQLRRLKNRPVFLVINKMDRLHLDDVFPLIDQYRKMADFSEIIPISAIQGDNIDRLLGLLKDNLPVGPFYFPEDQITDHPEQFIIKELIREKVLRLTSEEIPHSVTVVIEDIEFPVKDEQEELIQNQNMNEDPVHVRAAIITERQSQKGILIGKQGRMLKNIRKQSRRDIEHLLGSRIDLELWVKVQKDWRNQVNALKAYGYNPDDY